MKFFYALPRLFAVVLIVTVFEAHLAYAEDPYLYGPIEIENQYPLAQLHTGLAPTSAKVLSPQAITVSASFDWSNTSNYEDLYVVDAETRAWRFALNYGVAPHLEVGVALPLVWRGGGTLDHSIKTWHDFFSLPKGDRKRVDDDQYVIHGFRNDDRAFSLSDEEGVHAGNPTVQAKYQLAAFGNAAYDDSVAFLTRLGLPLAAASVASDRVDVVLGLLNTYCASSFCLYSGAAYLRYFDSEVSNVPFAMSHGEFFTHIEVPFIRHSSLLVGIYASSNLVEHIPHHPDYSVYLDTGMQIGLGEHSVLEILLRENPGPPSGTTDVTFHLGVRSTFT